LPKQGRHNRPRVSPAQKSFKSCRTCTTYAAMLTALFRALGDLASPEFRSILFKAFGLSVALFFTIFLAVQALFWSLTFTSTPWLESVAEIGASLGLFVAFFFLMAPVIAMFAGLYLDSVAEKVEAQHYAAHPPGKPQPFLKGLVLAIQFGLIVLVVNVLALPLVFTGLGAIVLVVINAYLLSREYFELAAMRFMAPADAKQLRKDNAVSIFTAGIIPALMALVPILNLTVPLFATSYFVHLFKQVQGSSA
jgi:CysZ protein